MPRINQNRMSLNTVGFTPTVFNPLDYKPETVDYGILERSFARQEARQAAAAEKSSAVDVALGKIETELHNDPKTQEWFNNYKNNIRQQIANATEVGDYAEAVNVATRLAGQVSSDSAILGRVKANQEYQTKVDETHKRAVAGKISADTERWWLANNQFKYEDVTDDNGNIIGGTSYNTLQTPVDDINIAEFTQQAFKMITPKVTDTKTTNADGTGSGYQRQWVTRQQIVDNLNNILDETPGARTAMNQRYKVEQYNYQQLLADPNADLATVEKQRNKMEKNGSPITFEEFCVRSIEESAISQNLAYDHRASVTDKQPTTKGNSKGTADDDEEVETNNQTSTSVKGEQFENPGRIKNAQSNANTSGKNAGNRRRG